MTPCANTKWDDTVVLLLAVTAAECFSVKRNHVLMSSWHNFTDQTPYWMSMSQCSEICTEKYQ